MRHLFAIICCLFLSSPIWANQEADIVVDQPVVSNNTNVVGTALDSASNFLNSAVNIISTPWFPTPWFSSNDVDCMARNIFHEAANEPEEGMVAVGVVTINRVNSGRYAESVCGVVNQRTGFKRWVVCQFSWTCTRVRTPKENDPRWIESQRIAIELSNGGYPEWREKYANSLHYHAYYVNPRWKLKRVTRTGAHIFYE